MNIKTFHNFRNETASTDGTRWWSGTDGDEDSIAYNLLQPVSALFPTPRPFAERMARARCVFISALRQTAPSVAPADDAERAVFRKAWDDATSFAAAHKVAATGVPVFSSRLMLVGTVDALAVRADGTMATYVYAPDGYRFAGPMNAVVRILHDWFPIPCEDDPDGVYTLKDLACGIQAMVLRDSTEWCKEHLKKLPL